MNTFESQVTADGSHTFYSPQFDENLHSKYGAKTESEVIYLQGCRLPEKISQQSTIKIIDICYGLGYNSATTIEYFLQKKQNSQCKLQIKALELDDTVPQQALEQGLLREWSTSTQDILKQLSQQKQVTTLQLDLELLIGDARQTIQKLVNNDFQADAIFLDPFSPPKCPQLWTVEFLQLVARCLQPRGIIATYSCSASIRTALKLANLAIGSNYGVGKKVPGTIASYKYQPLPNLGQMELEHLQTRASVPFRDPYLNDCANNIKLRREKEQCLSKLESTSQWKKRWLKV